jgi:hypothetical protein
VNFVGENVILETVLEHHDGVKGDRSADQGFLGQGATFWG